MAIKTVQTPRNWWVKLNTANIALDGTGTVGTDLMLLATGATTYGSFIGWFKVKVLATMGTAAVVRIFLNDGNAPSTAGANSLIAEITVPITTVSQVAAENEGTGELLWNFPGNAGQIQAGHAIYVTVSQNVSLQVTASGGDYAA